MLVLEHKKTYKMFSFAYDKVATTVNSQHHWYSHKTVFNKGFKDIKALTFPERHKSLNGWKNRDIVFSVIATGALPTLTSFLHHF